MTKRELPRPGGTEAALAAAALAVYLRTLARGPSWGDSCEFTLVADTWSISHPTGYPLYTLLGWFVSKLPLGPLPFRVGLLSAVPVALAVALTYRLALRFAPPRPAAAAALAFAFWAEPWSQATVPEVYGLHLLVVTAVLLALARLLEEPAPRRLLVLAFTGGLGFAHHMQTIFLVPGALAAVLADARTRALLRDPALFVRALAAGCAPALSYVLLLVRARQQPFVDQAGATTVSGLLAHLTGRQFAYRMFGEVDTGRELLRLGREVLAQPSSSVLLALPALALVARGLPPAARRAPALALGLAVSAAACLLYTVNYHIPDKSAYFLTLHLVLALALAAGLAALPPRALTLTCAFGVLIPLVTNYSVAERASDTSLEDYAADISKLVPPGSLLVTDDLTLWWGLVYRQQVEAADRDRALLCTYPMRLRWYVPFLRRLYPQLAVPAGLEDELAHGLDALEAAGDPTGQQSQALVERLTAKLVDANLARAPVTVVIHATSDDLKTWNGWPVQSLGLAYRVLRQPAPPEPYPTDYASAERHRVTHVHGVDQLRVARRYSTSLNRLGILYIQKNQLAEAERAFLRALEYDPLYVQVLTNLGVLYAEHMNRPADAYTTYRRFLEIAPDDKQAPAVSRWLGQYESRLVGRQSP